MSLFNRSSSKGDSQQPDAKHSDSQPDWWDAAFLVDEAKFRHQQHSVKRSSRDDQVTLGYILKEILNIDPADIGAMTIVSREAFASECKTETIEVPSDVLATRYWTALPKANAKYEAVRILSSSSPSVLLARFASNWTSERTSQTSTPTIRSSCICVLSTRSPKEASICACR